MADAALDWARTIAAGPRIAHELMKENVRDAQRLSLRDALPLESERMVQSGQTEEHRAAVAEWLRVATAKRQGRSRRVPTMRACPSLVRTAESTGGPQQRLLSEHRAELADAVAHGPEVHPRCPWPWPAGVR